MGYRRMTLEDLKSIFLRFHSNQNISKIALCESRDRKTVREYIKLFIKNGYSPGRVLKSDEEIYAFLKSLLPITRKDSPKSKDLNDLKEYISGLITDKKEAVKIKTAYEIIKTQHCWEGSYETFKLYVRKNNLAKRAANTTIRIELPPGLETQIDYGKVGTHYSQKDKRNRVVNAYCGILSSSRLPFIEFTYTQNEEEFSSSAINMFEFYEGVTEYISLDNLKSGVIKADLYDPKINKSFGETAEYYGVFVNPCRVASPKDKGKVERLVPQARELFRKLKILYPNENLAFYNKEAKKWSKEEYGMKEHGTTGIPPYSSYLEEKKSLKPLPEERFEICKWKKAKVHIDQFVNFEKKYYSLPVKYVGKEVWVKKSGDMVYIYFDYELLRSYIIPISSHRAYLKEDFPEVVREMLDGGYPKYLLSKAKNYGEKTHIYIEGILSPHAYLNARRAAGILTIIEEYKNHPYFEKVIDTAVYRRITLPKELKILFSDELYQKRFDFYEESSDAQKEMVRTASYYFD